MISKEMITVNTNNKVKYENLLFSLIILYVHFFT